MGFDYCLMVLDFPDQIQLLDISTWVVPIVFLMLIGDSSRFGLNRIFFPIRMCKCLLKIATSVEGGELFNFLA